MEKIDPKLLQNESVVSSLSNSLRGSVALKNVPGLLKRTLREGCWRSRYISQTRNVATFARFGDFVTAYPPEGLGATPDTLRNMCRDDVEALDLLTQELTGKPGNPTGTNQHSECGISDIITNSTFDSEVEAIDTNDGRGNTSTYALRKLRKSRPDLHADVLEGALSPHAAMVEAGFRKRYLQLPDDPQAAALYLLGNKDASWLLAFVAALDTG